MRQLTLNFQNYLEPSGEMTTSSSQEGSRDLVNHTQQRESDLEKKMTATSGRRCLDSYEKFNRPGLLAKMFPALLVGMEGWFSTRCRLIWNLRGTKFRRLYFQLAVSMPRTEGIESGLLHTPSAQEPGIKVERLITKDGQPARIGERAYDKHTGRLAQVGLIQQVQMVMLPTPKANDWKDSGDLEKLAALNETSQTALMRELSSMMILTPGASDEIRSGMSMETLRTGKKDGNFAQQIAHITGTSGQLNPPFVLEMMGFPPNWTELPFQNTETNP